MSDKHGRDESKPPPSAKGRSGGKEETGKPPPVVEPPPTTAGSERCDERQTGVAKGEEGSRAESPDSPAAQRPRRSRGASGGLESIAELQIPDFGLVAPFQLTDGEDVVAASRREPEMPVRASYLEGLKAIRSSGLPEEMQDQLQADHSREYMERKFRQWQAEQAAGLESVAPPKRPGARSLDDSGGTFQAITPELLEEKREGAASPGGARLEEQASPDNEDSEPAPTERRPFLGKEHHSLSLCSKHDSQAWSRACHRYPALLELFAPEEAVSLLQALVINEIHLYDGVDLEKDASVASRVVSPESVDAIGFSQLTPKIVFELERGLYGGRPLGDADDYLVSFLRSRGHSGEGHEARALLDPSCLPMLVAARVNVLIQYISKARDRVSGSVWINLSLPVLAYSYNPDVFFNPQSQEDPDFHPVYRNESYFERLRGYEKAFPTCVDRALEVSRHLDDVLYWLWRLTEGEQKT